VPSMAVELASRALGAALQIAPDGKTASLDGYRIQSALPNTMVVNFEGGADDIPTFSFADLAACAAAGNKDFFHEHFDGKVVVVGTVLDSEDRKLTSKRFVTGIEGARAARCASVTPPAATPFQRSSIAGVYIHATAVNNLIGRHAVREFGTLFSVPIAIVFSAVASLAALTLSPAFAALIFLAVTAAYVGGATIMFQVAALTLPVTEPLLSGLVAAVLTVAYRFAVSDRSRRFLRKSFELYLSPQVIETMMASNKLPALGGEMREVTVLFTDLVGFSSIAETMSPDALVQLMNEYLSAMTDLVEENRGYVEKYIGDSVVAVFGAPVDDPDHALHAVSAALDCRDRLDELNRSGTAFGGHRLRHRIGINTGEALVGNIGSRRRFNYTVMSDAVNVASRLEGANKHFGTSIMVSETTVQLTGTAFAWRELDTVRVKGRASPIRIYEPLARSGELTPEQSASNATYARGLALWRARDFAGAAAEFETLAGMGATAAVFLKRARTFDANPPSADWEPVSELSEE
jgi:adenylate cyclase